MMNNKFTQPNAELMNFFCDGIVGEPDIKDVDGVGEPSFTANEE